MTCRDVAPAGALRGVRRRRKVDEREVDLLTRLNFDDPRRLWTAAAGVRGQQTGQQGRSGVVALTRHVATAVRRRQYCNMINLQNTAY